MVRSGLHVVTRLVLRKDSVTAQDWYNQRQAFEDMALRLTAPQQPEGSILYCVPLQLPTTPALVLALLK